MALLHRIAIDVMSGDNGLKAAIPAALMFLKEYDDTALILVGDETQINQELTKLNQQTNERLIVQHASQVVLMDESPALALRGKKDSSMRVAINMVKEPELVHAIDGIEKPRVGLLNIGSEDMKGNEQVKAAHEKLQSGEFNYIGFVEGNDIFHGDVDVIVCDGFVGNVALKTTEGLAKMLSEEIKTGYTKSLYAKFAALISLPVIKSFRKRFDHRRYNGASFLGLKGIVIKSHGGADEIAFANAIGIARKAAIEKVPDRIEEHIQKHL